MTDQNETASWQRVFNTPLEVGLRSAALLLAAYPQTCDLQRLVHYDYLVVHSGDVDEGPPSIHPAIPHRSGEMLVRRSLVEQGLEFMSSRGVISRIFTVDGIEYVAGDYAVLFLDSLQAGYSKQLRERASWVVDRFQAVQNAELGSYMRARWSFWGAEFMHESLLEGTDE